LLTYLNCDIILNNGVIMKNNEKSKVNRKTNFIKYVVFIGVIVVCVINPVLLIEIKNNMYDTFYVDDVNFVYNQDETYFMTFKAISAQNKSYSGKTLYFYFKCYDNKGLMVDDDIQVKADGNKISVFSFYNSADGDVSMVSSKNISYCELNYAEIYNKKYERVVN